MKAAHLSIKSNVRCGVERVKSRLKIPAGCGRTLQFLLFVCLATNGVANIVQVARHHTGGVAATEARIAAHSSKRFNHHQEAVAGTEEVYEQQQQQKQQQLESLLRKGEDERCSSVDAYLQSIRPLPESRIAKAAICGGSCCNNETEAEMLNRAAAAYEMLLNHQTSSVKLILERVISTFPHHALKLSEASEKTAIQIYSRAYKQSYASQLINIIHKEINGFLNEPRKIGLNYNKLQQSMHEFFLTLFPLSYQRAVYFGSTKYGDLNAEFSECLRRKFDELSPYGSVPERIFTDLKQNLHAAIIFMNSLQHSADLLNELRNLYGEHMSETCKKQLLRLNYCPYCKGFPRNQIKVCHSYCINVLRGCSAQFVPMLENAWAKLLEAVDELIARRILTDSGVLATIRQLGRKLFDAVEISTHMQPEIQRKAELACGLPKLTASKAVKDYTEMTTHHNIASNLAEGIELKSLLYGITRHKHFFSDMENHACEVEGVEVGDAQCWNGDHIGKYTHAALASGADAQRYNPEIPLDESAQLTKFNELADRLLKLRKSIGAILTRARRMNPEMQGDMPHQDEEGSGRMTDTDDEEYGVVDGSGDGSGDNDDDAPPTYRNNVPTIITTNDIEIHSGAAALKIASAYERLVLAAGWTILAAGCHYRSN